LRMKSSGSGSVTDPGADRSSCSMSSRPMNAKPSLRTSRSYATYPLKEISRTAAEGLNADTWDSPLRGPAVTLSTTRWNPSQRQRFALEVCQFLAAQKY
jgi:hypothetical protein